MSQTNAIVTAALLIIGNEVLSGRTRDANLPYIAETLNAVGVRLREARIVPDIEAEIIEAVNGLRHRYDYVFTTGGIGPTHDDITAESIAKALNSPLVNNPEALRRLQQHYGMAGLELTPARLRMVRIPEGATLIDNPVSAAPGFQIDNVLVMAGVPRIMQAMLDGVKGRLRGGQPVLSRSVSCNLGEGVIAEGLTAIQHRYPDVDIGSYPRFTSSSDGFRVTVVLRHPDMARLNQVWVEVVQLIESLGGAVLPIDTTASTQ